MLPCPHACSSSRTLCARLHRAAAAARSAAGRVALWVWSGKNPDALKGVNTTAALSSHDLALLLFLFGRFSVTIARLETTGCCGPARVSCWRALAACASSPHWVSRVWTPSFRRPISGMARAAPCSGHGGGKPADPATGTHVRVLKARSCPTALRKPRAGSLAQPALFTTRRRRWIINLIKGFPVKRIACGRRRKTGVTLPLVQSPR